METRVALTIGYFGDRCNKYGGEVSECHYLNNCPAYQEPTCDLFGVLLRGNEDKRPYRHPECIETEVRKEARLAGSAND